MSFLAFPFLSGFFVALRQPDIPCNVNPPSHITATISITVLREGKQSLRAFQAFHKFQVCLVCLSLSCSADASPLCSFLEVIARVIGLGFSCNDKTKYTLQDVFHRRKEL